MAERTGLVPRTGGSNNDAIAEFAKAVPYKDPAEFERIRHALRSAGLPE